MIPTLLVIGAVILVAAAYSIKRARDRRELEQYSVTPEALHAMLASNRDVLVLDVRLPLDLLARSEIIPGATADPSPGSAAQPGADPTRERRDRLLHLSE